MPDPLPRVRRTSRRGFLGGLTLLATAGVYLIGTRFQPVSLPALAADETATATGAAPPATPTPEPFVEAIPGTPGRRTRKNLPPGRVVIPSIGLDSMVVPIGVKYDFRGVLIWETSDFVVGHYTNTANPGETGNCVLAGHISSPRAGAVFHALPNLEVGAGVAVMTAESVMLYNVADTRVVPPGATDIMTAGSGSKLTLITCVPDGIYSHRLIVTAFPV